jgi:C2 domain
VCMVSNPAATLVQATVEKRWSVLRSSIVGKGRNRRGSPKISKSQWPRSTLHKSSWNPHWSSEEVHGVIQTHRASDGMPLDLAGAMLHLTVLNHKLSGDDTVVGTVSFPLAHLLKSSQSRDRTKSSSNLNGHHNNHGLHRVMASLRKALHSNRSSANFSEGIDLSENNDSQHQLDVDEVPFQQSSPVVSVEIDEPLLCNGYERGRLKCTLEIWWMQARALSQTNLMRDRLPSSNLGENSRSTLEVKDTPSPPHKRGLHKRLSHRLFRT